MSELYLISELSSMSELYLMSELNTVVKWDKKLDEMDNVVVDET